MKRRKSINAKARASEDKTASIYGRRVPGSGSGVEKLDIVGERQYEGIRIENKWTEAKSYSLSLETLNKVRNQSIQMGAQGMMIIDFDDRRFVVAPEELFLSLMPSCCGDDHMDALGPCGCSCHGE